MLHPRDDYGQGVASASMVCSSPRRGGDDAQDLVDRAVGTFDAVRLVEGELFLDEDFVSGGRLPRFVLAGDAGFVGWILARMPGAPRHHVASAALAGSLDVGRPEDRDRVVQTVDHGQAAGGASPAGTQRGAADFEHGPLPPVAALDHVAQAGWSTSSATGKCQTRSWTV